MASMVLGLAAAAVAFVQTEAAQSSQADFDKFIVDYGRDYVKGSQQYSQRLELFQQRVAFIEAHNSQTQRRWTAGINHLADRTDMEMSRIYGWSRGARQPASLLGGSAERVEDMRAVADSIDWTNLSMASKVRDQGGCGSCWAVATVAMLEANHESQRKQQRQFSVQELVNCVPNPKECGGQGGCQGATVELAMKYAQENGLDSDENVPYQAADGTCSVSAVSHKQRSFLSQRSNKRDHTKTSLALQSWETLPENKAKPLMLALLDGPVAISVGASAWSFYSRGIFDSCNKDVVINHAVVLFGYGEDGSDKYWKIRNSWGKSWGENGYIRLLRQNTIEEEDARCGIDHKPEDGIACKPYPEQQTVCGMCGMLMDSVAVKFAPLTASDV